MNLLYANDRPGEYPASWYAATATPPGPYAPLRGETRADVCVVGGGYTGLSAALHLAQVGVHVVLVEAQRVGFGASGRNGGQVGSGQRLEQDALERMLGRTDARALWDLAEDGKALIHALCDAHDIDAGYRPGVVHADWHARDVPHAHAYADNLHRDYGYDQIEPLSRDQIRALVGSTAYHG
ncbi:FAD-binding oxidoreductase, partial [Escherichia coli]|nr:FAD-binding oxidoreductase [Escherichia coli]